MNKIACLAAFFLALIVGASAQNDNYSWNHLPSAELPKFKKDTFNIIKYGAVSDGITLNTKSINDAINDCNAKGGGVVLIPQGLWMTGPIVLKSNVNLHIVNSALVQFTDDKSQYQLVLGYFEGHPSPRNQSPISGTDLTNIAITGEGIIDGHGEVWRNIAKESLIESDWKKLVASGGVVSENGKEWYPSVGFVKGEKTKDATKVQPGKTLADYQDMKDFFRPNMVVLNNCKKILLQNTTFRNSPAWCLHILCCVDLTVKGARVRNNWNAHNGDAIDVESCKNILIEGSTFDAGDDGICVKSGRDEDGRKRGMPTENMVVRDCIVYRAHGGFVIGSEMSGGARNIFVYNCTFIGTDIGLRFKTTRGRGGIVEKIFIKDISMKDIVHEAILFDMYYMVKSDKKETLPVNEGTPQFRDFYVSNIVCDGAEKAIMVRGLPEMSIKGIHLENMTLKTQKGIELIEAEDISLKNISVFCSETNPVVLIDNGNKITLENIKYTSNSDLLFSINGEKSAAITVSKTDVSKARNKVTFNGGGTDKALIIY